MAKKISRKLATIIGAIMFAGGASAAEQWGTGNLSNVYPLADGSFVLILKASPPGCPNTSNPKYLYVVAGQNGVTADGLKAMLATSLTSIATGKEIQIAFSDATIYCYVNRLTIVDP